MEKFIFRIWHPNHDDVAIARNAMMHIILAPLLVVSLFLPIFFFPIYILVISIRAVIIIRGALIHPIGKDEEEKFKNYSKINMSICWYLAFLLPFVSFGTIPYLPDKMFSFSFFVFSIISIFLLAYTQISTKKFTLILLTFLFVLLAYFVVKEGVNGLLFTLLISLIALPNAYEQKVQFNKYLLSV